MQNKNKTYLLVSALFFVSMFFVAIDSHEKRAKADCYDICANEADPDSCYNACAGGDSIDQSYAQSSGNEGISTAIYTYAECKNDGGEESYCAGFPGAPAAAANISNMSDGTCSFNSDCGTGFTCYQKSCIDDATYKENVSFLDRSGNAVSQTFSSGGSVFSGGGTSSNSSVATIPKSTTINGATVPAGSKIMSDGSVVDSSYNAILPAGSVSTSGLSSSSGGNFSLCANGILAPVCSGSVGTPIVLGASNGLNYANGGTVGVSTPKCGVNFSEIGGVCFPTNTGLSSAPIYVILSNLFSWIMGLFTTLAVMAFVISGLQYLMASGDESLAKSAKTNASNALIGIIVGLSGFIIIKAISAALSGQGYFF